MNAKEIMTNFSNNPILFLEKIGIVDLVIKQNSLLGRCPLHNDHNPSFSIFIKNGVWKCFAGCGSGNFFQLYGKLNGIDVKNEFPKLIEKLNEDLK